MHLLILTAAIVFALALVHIAYVDFRFRHRGSVMWFWLAGPAPALLWVSRGAIALALVLAIASPFVGLGATVATFLVVLVLVHMVTLFIVEKREENWTPPPMPPE
ncbi:MAG TPA: hypothetical protein VM145_00355 [Sphingomicrobium sp.]|nr:hypothetical protein [Sphingomicrobium sp.]